MREVVPDGPPSVVHPTLRERRVPAPSVLEAWGNQLDEAFEDFNDYSREALEAFGPLRAPKLGSLYARRLGLPALCGELSQAACPATGYRSTLSGDKIPYCARPEEHVNGPWLADLKDMKCPLVYWIGVFCCCSFSVVISPTHLQLTLAAVWRGCSLAVPRRLISGSQVSTVRPHARDGA